MPGRGLGRDACLCALSFSHTVCRPRSVCVRLGKSFLIPALFYRAVIGNVATLRADRLPPVLAQLLSEIGNSKLSSCPPPTSHTAQL